MHQEEEGRRKWREEAEEGEGEDGEEDGRRGVGGGGDEARGTRKRWRHALIVGGGNGSSGQS